MTLRVVFRADASVAIGTGHIMRCLALAEALRQRGAECSFITRDMPGHLGAVIEDRGYAVSLLGAPSGPNPSAPPEHAAWAGVTWQQDLADTQATISEADWLVVDHYSFEKRWQDGMKNFVSRIMAIDDLADRSHSADLLLDQNLGRVVTDYDGLLNDTCRRLIGPDFALLRPEFAANRRASLARRHRARLSHLMITMGGTDAGGATSAVLRALIGAKLPSDMHITVVMGSRSPTVEQVRSLASQMPWPTEVLVDVRDMAVLMTQADLTIGAGGSTTWERCCLGLPGVIVETATNQAEAVAAMKDAGAALSTGPLENPSFGKNLVAAVMQAARSLEDLSERARQICDGEGARRVVVAMKLDTLTVRKARLSDATPVWHWRNHGDASIFYLDPTPTPLADHLTWFKTALASSSRDLLIIEYDGQPAAHVRLDKPTISINEVEVSICVNPIFRGKGMSRRFLLAAIASCEMTPDTTYIAKAHSQNIPSIRLFNSAGFELISDTDQFVVLALSAKNPKLKSDNMKLHGSR